MNIKQHRVGQSWGIPDPEWVRGYWWTLVCIAYGLLLGAMLFGCGGDARDACVRVPREQEELIGTLRCTSTGELQELDCEGWRTLLVCERPELCSPRPGPGCLEPIECVAQTPEGVITVFSNDAETVNFMLQREDSSTLVATSSRAYATANLGATELTYRRGSLYINGVVTSCTARVR